MTSLPAVTFTKKYQLGSLFYREVHITQPVRPGGADGPVGTELSVASRIVSRKGGEDLPYLLFLQGGPGMEAPRPFHDPAQPSWLPVALERYQVVFMDQRGTGESSPIDSRILDQGTAAEVAEYLTHFRADAIVRDAEALRTFLGVEQWALLGQSFGGFTSAHYCMSHPQSLSAVFFTGGLPALGHSVEDVYRRTLAAVDVEADRYFTRFPFDRSVWDDLLLQAMKGDIVLPTGEVVSVSRLKSLGMLLGSTHGWQRLHGLLDQDMGSDRFLYDLADALPYSPRNPLYGVLHESCWADGQATSWAASRVAEKPVMTAEHVDPAWFNTVPGWKPWKKVAGILANHPWPQLYDADLLRASQVPGAAAIYVDDIFVPLETSLATSRLMPRVKNWVTSEYAHDGLRVSGGKVLARLFELFDGTRAR